MTEIEQLRQQRVAGAGQATAIEQARVVAETEGKVYVAQQRPRNEELARAMILKACAEPLLAERAFFRYSRGGSTITGPSIHLAREIARCWGNLMYGITELRRDDQAHESEMRAHAWDMQTNTDTSTTFIVKHQRDANGRTVDLTTGRDVYENNANQGARRVREMIYAIVPAYIVEEAKQACMKTLESSDEPLEVRVQRAVDWFAQIPVTVKQLEDKLGSRRSQWRHLDIAALEIVVRALTQGETTVDDEFTPADTRRVDPAAIAAQASGAAGGAPADAPTSDGSEPTTLAAPDPVSAPITEAQFTEIGARLTAAGITDRTGSLLYVNDVLEQHGTDKRVRARKELAAVEAEWVLESLRADDEGYATTGRPPVAPPVETPKDPAVDQPEDPWANVEVKQPADAGQDTPLPEGGDQ
jgi:hypothetical protein